ncbi:MAG: hypothetical protein ACK5CE_12370 [Actinomycetes bacterium]|jgi:hypothetical protein
MSTITPTTSALIDAIQAFIAEQAQMVRAGLLAANEGNDTTARACVEDIDSAISTVRDAVRPSAPAFGWSDSVYSGLSETIPGFDELTMIIDREHIDDELDIAATVAQGIEAISSLGTVPA